jgi:hypothetical protein
LGDEPIDQDRVQPQVRVRAAVIVMLMPRIGQRRQRGCVGGIGIGSRMRVIMPMVVVIVVVIVVGRVFILAVGDAHQVGEADDSQVAAAGIASGLLCPRVQVHAHDHQDVGRAEHLKLPRRQFEAVRIAPRRQQRLHVGPAVHQMIHQACHGVNADNDVGSLVAAVLVVMTACRHRHRCRYNRRQSHQSPDADHVLTLRACTPIIA